MKFRMNISLSSLTVPDDHQTFANLFLVGGEFGLYCHWPEDLQASSVRRHSKYPKTVIFMQWHKKFAPSRRHFVKVFSGQYGQDYAAKLCPLP